VDSFISTFVYARSVAVLCALARASGAKTPWEARENRVIACSIGSLSLPDAAAAAAIVGVGVTIFSGVFFLGGLDSRVVALADEVSKLDSKFESRFDALDIKIDRMNSKVESKLDALDSKSDRMMLVNVALILVFGFSMTYFAQLK
jgi:hypothetical protein